MLRLGITGLSNCGKTSLFRALTGMVAPVGAAGKREVHVGQAKVPDARLDALEQLFHRPQQVNAIVEYVDVVGFASGEAARAGFRESATSWEDQFLGDLRTCEALVQVLRVFEAPGLKPADPGRDFTEAEHEFMLSDQIILDKRLRRLQKDFSKLPNKAEVTREMEVLERCLEALNNATPLRQLELKKEETVLLRAYQPLSLKPQLIVLNVAEDQVRQEREILEKWQPILALPGIELTAASASLEMEIAQLEAAAARDFMDDLGIETSALERVVRASYHLLGLISFFTIGHDECRAWTVPQGTKAREAAGAVHTDMERGFIRAEVVHYADFMPRKSLAACRGEGVLRLEGKDYLVQDGDIIEFRFAV